MIEKWLGYYDFWKSQMICVNSFTQISDLSLSELKQYINTKLKVQIEQKCDFKEFNHSEFSLESKPLERVYSFRKSGNVKLKTNLLDLYDIDLDEQQLREEIAEEI